jgi:L-malate glycosyltransferase
MKKKIKLVHVISNLGVGGAEGVLYQLLNHLDSSKFSHTVIYFRPGPYVEKIKKLGVKTYYVRGVLFRYDPVFLVKLFLLVQKLKPDCLHTLLWAANFLGRLIASVLRISHVEVLHNNIDQNGLIRTILDRVTAQRRGELVAVSDGVAQSLTQHAPWFTAVPVHIIKNGVPQYKASNKIDRADLGLSDAQFVIGSVGRFEAVKNYGLLLTAFALLYDEHRRARLVLVGQGSQENFLRTRAYDLGIDDRVIFVVGQDAQPYYQLFDCFVMSSYKEGISMALLEAMRQAIVPVVTSTSSTHDVINHGKNGFLLPSGDASKLAAGIDELIQSRALRRRLSENARTTVELHFKIERMANEYAELYQRVVFAKVSGKRYSN